MWKHNSNAPYKVISCLIECNTSMSIIKSCDWIWYGLDKFLDVGHINDQPLLHQIIAQVSYMLSRT